MPKRRPSPRRRSEREVDEPIVSAHLFAIHIVLGVEALDLTGDLRIELFGIAQRDWADATARLLYALPQCRHI
jgi:hypothetical protein